MILDDLLQGALAGLTGTVFMVLFELLFWKRWGVDELVEWQLNWAIVSRVAGRASRKPQNMRVSRAIASHLFHGTVSGVVFSLLLPGLVLLPGAKISVLLDALVYSLVLWVIFSAAPRNLYQARLGFRSSGRGLLLALSSHLVYGIVLGATLSL